MKDRNGMKRRREEGEDVGASATRLRSQTVMSSSGTCSMQRGCSMLPNCLHFRVLFDACPHNTAMKQPEQSAPSRTHPFDWNADTTVAKVPCIPKLAQKFYSDVFCAI
jgi:hypothetical protein